MAIITVSSIQDRYAPSQHVIVGVLIQELSGQYIAPSNFTFLEEDQAS